MHWDMDPLRTLRSAINERIGHLQNAIRENPAGYEDFMAPLQKYRQARIAFEDDFPETRFRLDDLIALLIAHYEDVASESYLQGVIDSVELMWRFLPRTKNGEITPIKAP